MDKRRRPVAFEGTCAEAAPDVARKSVRFGSLSIEVATDAAREVKVVLLGRVFELIAVVEHEVWLEFSIVLRRSTGQGRLLLLLLLLLRSVCSTSSTSTV
jgi:hypothetical protein